MTMSIFKNDDMNNKNDSKKNICNKKHERKQ